MLLTLLLSITTSLSLSLSLSLTTTPQSKFILVRHGQSFANVANIISSHPTAQKEHGLTPLGKEQASEAGKSLFTLISGLGDSPGKLGKFAEVVFYSSPFTRAFETAEVAIRSLKEEVDRGEFALMLALHDDDLYIDEDMRERNFGRLCGTDIDNYSYVWPMDRIDPTHAAFDVEPVVDVAKRCEAFLKRVDGVSDENTINVVFGHADTLQIMQCLCCGLPNIGEFSGYRFKNGEARILGFGDVQLLPPESKLEKPDRLQKR